jgi:hypothetical protein
MWHDFSCNTTFPLLVGFDTATPGRLAPGGWNGIVTDTALQERTDTSWLSTSFFLSAKHWLSTFELGMFYCVQNTQQI